MIRTTICALTAAISCTLSAAAAGFPARQTYCSDSLVRGTYAIQLQGTQALPDGSTANIIGVVIRVYDGEGRVTQWDNVKNSVTGYVPNRYGAGRYQVHDDCTVDVVFNPAPGATIQERLVIMDDGNELRSITVLPPGLFVSSTSKRI